MDFDPFKDPKVSPGILVHAPTESDLSVDRRDESNNNQDTSNHNINLNLNLGYNNNTSSAQSSTDELSSNTGTQRSISRRNPFRRNSSLSKSYSSAKSSHTPNLGREARTPSPERNNSVRRFSNSHSPHSPHINSKSLFNEAAEDQDFEAIREGLSFALGNDNKDAEWFPVSSGFKATSSPERNNSNATSNEFLHSPSGINDSHLYSDNIPLDNLKISPNHTGEGTSPRPPLSARNQSFPSHLSPHDFNKRENLSPTSHSSNNIPKASKDPSILESGLLSPALNHPSSASSKFDDASPNKFSNVITRLSDRIAGTGAAASPVTDKPAQDSQLYRQKSNSSAHSSDHSSGGEASIHSPNSIPNYDRSYSYISQNTAVPATTVTDENNNSIQIGDSTNSDNPTFSNGLGLYLSENPSNKSFNSPNSNHNPDESFHSNAGASQAGILHNLKPSDGPQSPHTATSPFKPYKFANNDSLYLFGNTLKIFSPDSKIRRFCHRLLSHHSTNLFLLSLLVLQVILLSYRQWNPMKLRGYYYHGYNWADYVLITINIFYTLEIFGKIIAYGFIDDHVMFSDLGLKYPENELKTNYFQQNHIVRFLKKLGFGKVFFRNTETTRRTEGYNKPQFSSSDEENGNLSEDLDIKEINLDENTHEKPSHKKNNPFTDDYLIRSSRVNQSEPELNNYRIQNKYERHATFADQDAHTKNEPDPSDLSDKPIIGSQRFDVTNTFIIPSNKNHLDQLQLRRAYIRNSWHRIDFLSMICFWISLLLSIGHYDAKHHIFLFRALSCLRILRLCNLTTGTTTILTACKLAIPQLIDVAIFISCFWLFFGIIGVQSFKSSLTRHCEWTNPNDSNDTYTNTDQYCGSYIGLDGKAKPYITRDGSSSDTIKGYRCPKFSKCVSGENPYAGTVNFDNILQSLEMVFIVMSANTFTDIMYYTMDSDNMAACLFFIFGIFILTVWLINVFIAVIVASFNITRMEADEQKKQRKRKKGIMDFLGFVNTDASVHNEKINLLKRQNVGLRYYYKFEFFFIIAIILDLFVQCFRSYSMSDTQRHTLYRFESAFTAVFAVEIIIRFALHFPNWRMFFTSRRNVFDLFLVIITVIIIIDPIKTRLGHGYYWLTVFQIMRFYRVVLATGITRNLWMKLMGNFRAIFDLALFFFILLFLVSIILSRYFEGTVPEDDLDDVDFPMHTLPNSFVALYVITSTENWSDILYSLQEYSRTTSSRSFGAMFLIGWFILSNMVILNIFIAVIAKTLEVSEEGKRKKQLLQFIDDMTEKLQNLDSESGLLSKIKKKVFRHKGVKDDLEKAVVNLLLSGTAVNEFLDRDPTKSEDEDTEKVKTLPSSSWKRWFQVNFWRTSNYLRNPFFTRRSQKHEITNFEPAHFAKNIITERNLLISKQNKFLKENPKFNNVFYVLKPRHRLRRFCQRLVKSSYGERIDGVEPNKIVSEIFVVVMFLATIGLVVTACYLTPLYRKYMVNLYGTLNWTFYLEVGFNVLFTLEFFIKITADGLIFTPNSYMRSSWNLIDLLVLVSLWIEFIAFLKNDGNLSRIVRGLKALRALRLLTISETAKSNFHNTIITGFWKIISAAIISLCLLFPFSIWGLNVFNGRLGYCLDGESTEGECQGEFKSTVFNWDVMSPNVYTNPQLEFDTFPTSFATLFEIVSLEGWSDLLLNVMKSTGVGTVPEDYATPFNGFFVVLFNFISIVFILTLFISVIISNYSKTTGRAYMTTDQISWYQVKKFLIQVKPSKRKDFSTLSSLERFCYRMTVEKNKYWNGLLNFVLVLHVLSLLLECFPSRHSLDTFRQAVFILASSMFVINAVMLCIGQGFKTFVKFKWNVFNFFVSVGAFLSTICSFLIRADSVFININKLFLVGILAFIIPRSNRLSQLLRFASASLPTLLSLSFTWVVIFLVFAIAMNQIFGLTKVGLHGSGNINLRSVPKALILLFRCSFGEGWNYIMEDYTVESPFCSSASSMDDSDCGNKQYAYILFMAWNIVSMYIFLNMFISLILDSFSYISHRSDYSHFIKREEVRKFKRTWQMFDPKGTGYIKPIHLPALLHSLEGAFSYHFYTGELEIKHLCGKWFKRNNPNDPYNITVNYKAIEETLNAMDIPKIRERRKSYEKFMEEAIMTMEINNDPGISFTRILLQLPLYTAFESGQCLNLIDFLERRLLIQKVEKRLHTKRVYETIAAYACRWKYKKDQRHGIKDDNIDFGKELRRHSYLANENLGVNAPSIYVTNPDDGNSDKLNESYDDEDENFPLTKSTGISDYNIDSAGTPDINEGTTSGIYVPKSPIHIYKARNRSQNPASQSDQAQSSSQKEVPPKLYIQIPSSNSKSTSPISSHSSMSSKDDIIISQQASPFLDSNELTNSGGGNDQISNVSLIDLTTIGETLENSSWGEALREVQSDQRSSDRSENGKDPNKEM